MSSDVELEPEQSEPETETTVDGGLNRLTLPGMADLEEDEVIVRRRSSEQDG
jgi:hypothetical protein